MKNARRRIYIKATLEKNEIEYSGIEFAEFFNYLPSPMENLMIITGGSNVLSLDTRFERGLEVFDGYGQIEKLTNENIYNFGNFCFVDFMSSQNVSDLSEEQIAELLYLGHLFKPLRSPFFEPLHNNFAYLAHDDGWYCKLYCQNPLDFITVLCKKIIANELSGNICEPSDSVKENILNLATHGLLIDLDESFYKPEDFEIKLYIIESHSDIDIILNNYQKLKEAATKTYSLHYNKVEWNIS